MCGLQLDDYRLWKHRLALTWTFTIGLLEVDSDHGRYDDREGTKDHARPPAVARPQVNIAGRETLVMCDQLATVDLVRLSGSAGFLTLDEMQDVDEALSLVLNLG